MSGIEPVRVLQFIKDNVGPTRKFNDTVDYIDRVSYGICMRYDNYPHDVTILGRKFHIGVTDFEFH